MQKRIAVFLILSLTACATTPVVQAPSRAAKAAAKANPATIDFGEFWKGKVRIKQKSVPDLGNKARAMFKSEWTLGESAGIVYPKKFTTSASKEPVHMEFLQDNGGLIPAGVYDVIVDIDGAIPAGTIKNLKIEKGFSYEISLFFSAAKIAIPLETDGDQVIAYPAGTHDKYEKLGRLDSIPNEIVINAVSSYTDKNQIYWLIPAGIPVDVLRTFSNGDPKWFLNHTATPESAIKTLP